MHLLNWLLLLHILVIRSSCGSLTALIRAIVRQAGLGLGYCCLPAAAHVPLLFLHLQRRFSRLWSTKKDGVFLLLAMAPHHVSPPAGHGTTTASGHDRPCQHDALSLALTASTFLALELHT
jgi:hypothetical protein